MTMTLDNGIRRTPTTSHDFAVEIRELGKTFGVGGRAVRALADVSLSVRPGEFVCLLGASGCGKSTLLNLVAGLDSPSTGGVTVNTSRPAVMFQEAALLPWLTAARNVELPLRLAGWRRAERRAKAAELLDLVRLSGQDSKRPHELSGGMRQRVALARALAASSGSARDDTPGLLLMDEPFGALDAITRDALQAELGHIHRATKKTIVFVTHDIEEALRLATQIAVMDQGQIAQLGSPLEILEHPASDFVADFVGRQGIGLKLLSVRKIADQLRPGETAEGEPLSVDMSLRDAFSAMTTRHTDRLPVCDAEGRTVGVIALADLVR